MIETSSPVRVYLAREPADFRQQIDGLALRVQEVLALDPFAPQVFVFRNRAGDKLKALYWHGNGFCLLYKRLERGRFVWPAMTGPIWACTQRELQWLLDGLDLSALKQPEKLPVQRI